jgi:hypothetical protein
MTGYINGVNMLPGTGEFTYDPNYYLGRRATESSFSPINGYAVQPNYRTDVDLALDQLQTLVPGCTTVAIICAWFFNSTNAASCNIYPSTTYIGGQFKAWIPAYNTFGTDSWRCSGLTQSTVGLIPISTLPNGSSVYGGTPSDQSIVRCIRDAKNRGLRVVFYPFLLGDIPGSNPWRGRITFSPDVSSAASAAVASFLGSASTGQFTQDTTNLTVAYSGSATDWTYRRMILHYANLCVVAGGVDLFLLGSELRGLETVRGASWAPAGATSGGVTTWDYPFVNGLATLSDDVRSVFDGASLTKNTTLFENLISYGADWSSWMGWQHTGSNPSNYGQWPHLDQLWSHSNIDLVCFDNYLPLSDWTSGSGGLDAANWSGTPPVNPVTLAGWPPSSPDTIGLGLSGTPTLYSKPYLKANIEGGEKFNWYYLDGANGVLGSDPNGPGEISVPAGDRLSQSRNAYGAGTQITANKMLRWWWNNPHHALYPTGAASSGSWVNQGQTGWVANSKSIAFTEYGYPSCDKSTNQPNVFFTNNSGESATAYWSAWQTVSGGAVTPVPDTTISQLALQAVYEYWFSDTPSNNPVSTAVVPAGIPMLQQSFCSVWNWDARPSPYFPRLSNVWGDSSNYAFGNWVNGKGPYVINPFPTLPANPPIFPALPGSGFSIKKSPIWSTQIADHVSGRKTAIAHYRNPIWEFELQYEGLDANFSQEGLFYRSLQVLLSANLNAEGQLLPFIYVDPLDNFASNVPIGIGDGVTSAFQFNRPVGNYSEVAGYVIAIDQVCFNGVAQYGNWNFEAPNVVTFNPPPTAGAQITATFNFGYLCRFKSDQEDFENFMSGLWRVSSLTFRTIRA